MIYRISDAPRVLAVLVMALAGLLASCNDNYQPGQGCETDDDCSFPRTCVSGLCVDPVGVDVGQDTGDVQIDTPPDIVDDVVIPDVPPPRGCVRVVPNELDFGLIRRGEIETRSVRVENCGRTDIEFGGAFSAAPDPIFQIVGLGPIPTTIAPGDDSAFLVEATGAQTGFFDGVITVDTSVEVVDIPVSVSVTEENATSCVRLAPLTNFGTVSVGDGVNAGVNVTNCGETPIRMLDAFVDGPGAAAFGVDGLDTGVIPAGGRGVIAVSFVPPRQGEFEAELTVVTDVAGDATGVLFGNGGREPRACLDFGPDVADFGLLEEGETAIESIAIVNCGETEIRFEDPILTGDPGFDVDDRVFGALNPGEQVFMDVVFTATRPGTYNARYRLEPTTDGLAPVIIDFVAEVLGEGFACIEMPDFVDAGRVPVGSSRAVEFAVENCGDVPLDLEFDLTNEDPPGAWDLIDVPGRIQPGGIGTVVVEFVPRELGEHVVDVVAFGPGGASGATVVAGQGIDEGADCLRASPSLHVANADVGERVVLDVLISNCGEPDVQVDFWDLFGDTDQFFLATEPFPLFLASGESFDLQVVFAPRRSGTFRATLEIFGPTVEATVQFQGVANGNGDEPCLFYEPDFVDFGVIPLGEVREFPVIVQNCGNVPLEFGEPFIESPFGNVFFLEPPFFLGPGEAFELIVVVEAIEPGPFDAFYFQEVFADVPPLEFPIFGEVEFEPEVCIASEQPNVEFGDVFVGDEVTRSIQLVNCGSTSFTVTGADLITGAGRGFSVSTRRRNVNPGQTFTVNATFAPLFPGTFSGNYTIRTTAGDVSEVYTLRGTGFDPDICFTFDEEEIDFGQVDINTDGIPVITTRIINCGDVELVLDGWEMADGRAFTGDVDFFPFGPVLPIGGAATVNFSFFPPSVGNFSDIFSITAIDPIDRRVTAEIGLTGEGVDNSFPCIEPLQEEFIDFGVITPGRRVRREINFFNCGSIPVNLINGGIDSDGAFSLIGIPPTPIFPGEIQTFVVEFSSSRPGDHFGFGFVDYEFGFSFGVELFGRVQSDTSGPRIRVEPPFIDFGDVPSGEIAQDVVNVCNDGDEDLFLMPGLDTRGAFDVIIPPDTLVRPGECLPLIVQFAPIVPDGTAQEFFETLEVWSNDPVTEIVPVDLFGVGFSDADTVCLQPLDPELFFVANPGEFFEAETVFRNCGTTSLRMRDVYGQSLGFNPEFAFVEFFDPPPGGLIRPGQEVFVVIAVSAEFMPGVYEQEIVVETDRVTARQPVILEVVGGFPCIDVSPDAVNFGTVDVGRTERRTVTISNCGDVPVFVDAFVESGGMLGFNSSPTALVPGTLNPGQFARVPVTYTPFFEGFVSDSLRVFTDFGEERVVRLTGTGLDGDVCPMLVPGASDEPDGPFDADLQVRRGTTFYLDSGVPADWPGFIGWNIESLPPGATFNGFGDTGVNGRVSYFGDSVGVYTFRVEIGSDDGMCFQEAFVSVEVIERRIEGLRFVVTWTTPGDPNELEDPGSDVDMHVVRRGEDGRVLYNGPRDCYYGNCRGGLEWGDPDYTGDNPRLLRDEVDGLGPEIIVIDDPEEDAEYIVAMHYFSDDGFGQSNLTLRIFVDGAQAEFAFESLPQTNDVWLAASIRNGGDVVEILDFDIFDGFPGPFVP